MEIKQPSPKKTVLEFLNKNHLATLCVISPEGQPRASSIYTIADDDLTFYFITKVKTAKYSNIQKNNKVALVITDENGYKTVQVEGEADEIRVIDKRYWIISRLSHITASHHEWHPPIDQLDAADYAFMKIKPTWLRWANFYEENRKGNIFEQIIPTS